MQHLTIIIKEGIGAEVKRLRLERGLTFEALALYARVDLISLKEIEAGEKQPTITTLFKLSKALNTTPDKLILPSYGHWLTVQRDMGE